MKKEFVVRSINNSDQSLCIDIFKRKDNTYGFEEYRRDKETHEGWYKVHSYGHDVYLSEQEALTSAYKNVSWLKENTSNINLKN
jgi:hypothetical protein|tara:strand:- start:30 stop:281 length:252 start_codon:yes stop_codon:yes gene_type:complete